MRTAHRGLLIALVMLVAAPWPGAAQTQTAPDTVALRPAEMEQFLLNAKIVKLGKRSRGVTQPRCHACRMGRITHDAQIRTWTSISRSSKVDPKHTEVKFRDQLPLQRRRIRLAVQLGLDNVAMPWNVPTAASRRETWWLDGGKDEADRRKREDQNHDQRGPTNTPAA